MKEFLLKRYPLKRREMPRKVAAHVATYRNGERAPWHQHEHGQLVFALQGVVRVLTPAKTWTLPQSRALWLPPNIDHELHAVGDIELCNVYIARDASPWPWHEPGVIAASSLLRELALGMSPDGFEYSPDSQAALSVPLLLKVLGSAQSLPESGLPVPRDPRLLSICEHMMTEPSSDYSLDLWGEKFGASGRTLARRFKLETGMTFGLWRQHMRAAEAITRLALGDSVARVSIDLGYSSPSAFIVMFRQLVGETPQQYVSSR